jgi:thiol-disulfide isomerase/thioredoxin
MLKRLLVPIIVMALAGAASAQNDDSDKQPAKRSTPPAKAPAPKKDTKSQPKKKKAALNVGDKAPAIKAERWVKGAPVKAFEKGSVYVVEFWATWCPPCERSIPHLTELQQKHKGLTVIGVAASEHKETTGADRRLAELERWVRAKGDQMRYTVAYEGDKQMYREWMSAAGQTGIPCAFIVDGEGIITFIGFPSGSDFDGKVEQTLKATADKKQAEDAKQKKDKSKQDDKSTKPQAPVNPSKPTDSSLPAKDDKKK